MSSLGSWEKTKERLENSMRLQREQRVLQSILMGGGVFNTYDASTGEERREKHVRSERVDPPMLEAGR